MLEEHAHGMLLRNRAGRGETKDMAVRAGPLDREVAVAVVIALDVVRIMRRLQPTAIGADELERHGVCFP